MSRMSGADADALDAAGVRLERAGVELRNRSRRLQRQVNSSPWQGRSADRFRSEFNSVHVRAMQQAAQFLDNAYEELLRQADQQRAASGQGRRSIWDRIRLEVGRVPTWVRRLPGFGWFDRPEFRRPIWPILGIPLFPWLPDGWFRPRWPVTPLPDIRPIDPSDWIDDLLIGVGLGAFAPLVGLIPGIIGRDGATPGVQGLPQPTPAPVTPNHPQAPTPPAPTPATDAATAWGRSITWQEAQAIVDREIPAGERRSYDYDGNRDGSGHWYQCTTWAKARWRELGYTGDWSGDGDQVAHNINKDLGRPDSRVPTVGAIVSFTDEGHVAVVEKVFYDGAGNPTAFEVSEMNYNHNADRYGRTDWRIARADEFGTRRVTVNSSTQVFAPFPG